jgi:hypothetical protein
MDRTTIKRFKWFWAWQDEAEEAWLAEMSKKGLHLSSAGLPGIYTFDVGEPCDYVYRLDFQTVPKKDKQVYLQLFRDAGWEYIGEMSSWQYFQKEARPGEVNEIFTDVESKIAKYKRVLVFLGFFYIIMVTIFAGRFLEENPYPWFSGIKVFIFLILVLFSYAVIRLVIRIRQLKKL